MLLIWRNNKVVLIHRELRDILPQPNRMWAENQILGLDKSIALTQVLHCFKLTPPPTFILSLTSSQVFAQQTLKIPPELSSGQLRRNSAFQPVCLSPLLISSTPHTLKNYPPVFHFSLYKKSIKDLMLGNTTSSLLPNLFTVSLRLCGTFHQRCSERQNCKQKSKQ